MRPVLREISTSEEVWFYVSSIGGCFALIIITSILIHVLLHYYHILKSKSIKSRNRQKVINGGNNNNNRKNQKITKFKQFHHEAVNKKKKQRIISILTISYLFTSFLTVLMYAFVRSNIITRINHNSFNLLQCQFGYILSISLFNFSKIFMYLLFIFRIQIIFNDTEYQYKPYYYKILYVANGLHITIIHIVLLILIINNINEENMDKYDTKWILYKSNDNLIFCSLDFNHNILSKNIGMIILLTLSTISELFISVSLLVMFIKGLRELNMSLLQQYIHDHFDLDLQNTPKSRSRGSRERKNSNSGKYIHNKLDEELSVELKGNGTTIEMNTDLNNDNFLKKLEECPRHKSLEMVIRRNSSLIGVDGYSMDNDYGLQRVIRMHNLIKKQTILVVIAIISSLLIWLLYICVNKVWLFTSWDVLLNTICIWFMFSFTKKYWNFAKRYCCCKICYFNDINRLLNSS